MWSRSRFIFELPTCSVTQTTGAVSVMVTIISTSASSLAVLEVGVETGEGVDDGEGVEGGGGAARGVEEGATGGLEAGTCTFSWTTGVLGLGTGDADVEAEDGAGSSPPYAPGLSQQTSTSRSAVSGAALVASFWSGVL